MLLFSLVPPLQVLWLQDYLLKWPKTLVVVSHAREFLNTVCTDVLHLHSRAITTYRVSEWQGCVCGGGC
jgi:ATPase subunit of ABC transporter with duplicated ATPase domains